MRFFWPRGWKRIGWCVMLPPFLSRRPFCRRRGHWFHGQQVCSPVNQMQFMTWSRDAARIVSWCQRWNERNTAVSASCTFNKTFLARELFFVFLPVLLLLERNFLICFHFLTNVTYGSFLSFCRMYERRRRAERAPWWVTLRHHVLCDVIWRQLTSDKMA